MTCHFGYYLTMPSVGSRKRTSLGQLAKLVTLEFIGVSESSLLSTWRPPNELVIGLSISLRKEGETPR